MGNFLSRQTLILPLFWRRIREGSSSQLIPDIWTLIRTPPSCWKKNPRKVDFSNGSVDIFNFKKGEHSLMLYSYVYILTYYIENTSSNYVSNFQSFLVWSLDYITRHARSKWEILQPSLDLTIAKKKITENATRYYSYFSRGQNSIFWWMQHVYICWGFFLVEFVYFYELKNPWSKKGGRKKNSARKFLQQMFSEILFFWGYLFTFRAACLIKNPPFRLSIDL